MTTITNGAVAFSADELAWFAEDYGTTEWAVYFPGMDEITTRDRHYPGDEVAGEPFTEATVRAYLADFDSRFGPGSPLAREVHNPSYAVALHYGVPAFGSHDPAARVLDDIRAERLRQVAKWGEQHREDDTGGPGVGHVLRAARESCQQAEANGGASWRQVLTEEFYEAVAETDPDALRNELIQVAAVCAAWVEDIDLRKAGA